MDLKRHQLAVAFKEMVPDSEQRENYFAENTVFCTQLRNDRNAHRTRAAIIAAIRIEPLNLAHERPMMPPDLGTPHEQGVNYQIGQWPSARSVISLFANVTFGRVGLVGRRPETVVTCGMRARRACSAC